MSFESDIRKNQKIHFSQDKSAHSSFDETDTEQYADKVATEFHKRRREEWWDNYKLNYRNRHKDQKDARKAELD